MDTFNFLVSILLMMMAIQSNETWIVLVVLVISVITSKDLSTVLAFVIATVVLYIVVGSGQVDDLWPLAIFGLVVIAILLSGSNSAPPADPYAGLGGMGDFSGGGGY